MTQKFQDPATVVADLCDLIYHQEECEYLDFKQKFHESNLKLVHDIMCLANAYTDSDRYLVFGVSDQKDIIGVQNDTNRKKGSNIQDMLRSSNFNRIPTVYLMTVVYSPSNKIEIDVLVIKNRPDKPFFLNKDKREGKDTIRAGVVYTRLGDTNTPLSETAQEDQIELMWRERFGFGLSPFKRAEILLSDPHAWISVNDDRQIYHEQFPEFTIREGRIVKEDFQERWTKNFSNIRAYSFEVEVRFFETILAVRTFVRCDDNRYQIPLPYIDKEAERFYIIEDSLEYKIAQILGQCSPLQHALKTAEIDIKDKNFEQ